MDMKCGVALNNNSLYIYIILGIDRIKLDYIRCNGEDFRVLKPYGYS